MKQTGGKPRISESERLEGRSISESETLETKIYSKSKSPEEMKERGDSEIEPLERK